MFTMSAKTDDGGHVILVILQKPNVDQLSDYIPLAVPTEILDLRGPCRGIEIAYIKPEDEAKLLELGKIGDGEGIATLVSAGKFEPAKDGKLIYHKVSETIQ